MCGIGGILAFGPGTLVEPSELEELGQAQLHRGPDDAGAWTSDDRRIGLVHRRLSIIDLSPRGHQPMSTGDGRLWITYNGEIYNHEALRRDLEAKGVKFRSTSDTEVILHGFREWGTAVVDRLRGMFAFAIWDDERQTLFLARDPLGIKPLFFVESNQRLAFASEPRALLNVADVGEIDPEALACFLLWGSIASPLSLYSRVRALEPGTWLEVSADRTRSRQRYWQIEDAFEQNGRSDQRDAASVITHALRDSVANHLVADVPVGAFLSGGVDSSALVGLVAELHGGPIETVTLAFDVEHLDESVLAARASRLYGTRHHEIRLGVEEVREEIPNAIRAMAQPTIDGINTYFVSKAAVAAGLKVAISGVGGDELFGGYDSFKRIPRILGANGFLRHVPGLTDVLDAASVSLGQTSPVAKLARALRFGSSACGAYYAVRGIFSPREVAELLVPDVRRHLTTMDPVGWLDGRIALSRVPEADRVSALEIRQYLQSQLLRDTDAASMAHSLEVRTPLVDRDLLMTVASVPARERFAGRAKRPLRQAPRPSVPTELWKRRKQGFALPIDQWLRSKRLDLTLPSHPALSDQAMEHVKEGFESGRQHWSRYWALVVLGRFLGGM